jgi:hypothetical protein
MRYSYVVVAGLVCGGRKGGGSQIEGGELSGGSSERNLGSAITKSLPGFTATTVYI